MLDNIQAYKQIYLKNIQANLFKKDPITNFYLGNILTTERFKMFLKSI